MQEQMGKALHGGIAIGRIEYHQKKTLNVKRTRIDSPQVEYKRYCNARESAIIELQELYTKAVKEVGEINAGIFEVHQLMLQDVEFDDSVKNIIFEQQMNAEYAVAITGDHLSSMFEEMEDEYFRSKAADIKDVSERVIRILNDPELNGSAEDQEDEDIILMAYDLAPSETVQLDKSKIRAFVTKEGSTNSHTAILARTMNIPALVGIEYAEDMQGKTAIVDGWNSMFLVDPDEEVLKHFREKRDQDERDRDLLIHYANKKTMTKSGKEIHLYANIGGVSDLSFVKKNGAEGIGLFRSEFLYLGREDYPSEEEQFQAYRQVAETMAGKPVIIRTMDIGADKQVDYFGLEPEENPALGYRAIRICFDRPEMFKTQLRAIFRASAYGNISVMFPMIISLEEIFLIKGIIKEVKEDLKENGIPYKEIQIGIMIETPAAALISDQLAEQVDFFSIGTNDLTQYTLALDRQNGKLSGYYKGCHESILTLIQMSVDSAKRAGIWVGICGEMGGDPELITKFIQMGVDEVSVTPSDILPLRKIVCESDL